MMVSASCSTQGPPSPLCHYVIISSTPSLPLSSPFTEQAHNKTHSVTLCIFTPSLLALDETASPSQLVPLGAFFFFFYVGWRRTSSLIERFILLSKGSNGASLSRSAGGGVSWLLQTSGSRSVCKTSRGKRFQILASDLKTNHE